MSLVLPLPPCPLPFTLTPAVLVGSGAGESQHRSTERAERDVAAHSLCPPKLFNDVPLRCLSSLCLWPFCDP
eukprot:9470214-Pyramimonas_sp.AAC.1